MNARYTVLAVICAGTSLAAAAQNSSGCEPGTVLVEEKVTRQGNVTYVQPICRRIRDQSRAVAPIEARLAPDSRLSVRSANGVLVEANRSAPLPLVDGASLETGPRDHATLMIPDGPSLELGANTQVVIRRPAVSANQPAPQMTLEVRRGALDWRSRLAQWWNRRFSVRVGRVSVSVRGTVFSVRVDSSQSGLISVQEGEIEYRDADGRLSRIIRAGQQLRLRQGRPVVRR